MVKLDKKTFKKNFKIALVAVLILLYFFNQLLYVYSCKALNKRYLAFIKF